VKADRPGGSEDEWRDLVRLATLRMEEYAQLWEGAAAKFRDSSYRSEDLLDDWFKFWGKAVRDVTAAGAFWWTASTRDVPGRTAARDDRRGDSER
jgi:hypothetical protein